MDRAFITFSFGCCTADRVDGFTLRYVKMAPPTNGKPPYACLRVVSHVTRAVIGPHALAGVLHERPCPPGTHRAGEWVQTQHEAIITCFIRVLLFANSS